jgi:membrane fusion protein, multidrug efflux system
LVTPGRARTYQHLTSASELPESSRQEAIRVKGLWQKYAIPAAVVLLGLAVIVTLTYKWNAWEGERRQQVTNDAYVRRDITPLSTKVAGLVHTVCVEDYQHVRKGDELVILEDSDFQAQVAQAEAAVEAAKAAMENNRRQLNLQDSRIARALAGVDQATAQITAAQAGKQAVDADVIRTRSERTRQEALLEVRSTTQQKVESAVADEARFAAQATSRDADLNPPSSQPASTSATPASSLRPMGRWGSGRCVPGSSSLRARR